MGRVLAIDYGSKRVGIAVTDPAKIIASPLTTVASNEIFPYLKDYIKSEEIETFVVGYPLTLSGEDAESMRLVKTFIKALKNKFPDIPIVKIDERFTSKIAFQAMLDGGLKKKARQNKGTIDKVSAAILLQSFLERQK